MGFNNEHRILKTNITSPLASEIVVLGNRTGGKSPVR